MFLHSKTSVGLNPFQLKWICISFCTEMLQTLTIWHYCCYSSDESIPCLADFVFVFPVIFKEFCAESSSDCWGGGVYCFTNLQDTKQLQNPLCLGFWVDWRPFCWVKTQRVDTFNVKGSIQLMVLKKTLSFFIRFLLWAEGSNSSSADLWRNHR